MDEIREKIAREIARSQGCTFDSGYGKAHHNRFYRDADRILDIPEIKEALTARNVLLAAQMPDLPLERVGEIIRSLDDRNSD